MTSAKNNITNTTATDHLTVQPSAVSKLKPIGFALLIIAGLGGLVVGAVGACGYFQVGSISQIVIMSGGGVGGIAFLVVGIIGMVKSCKKQYHPIETPPQVNPAPANGQPHNTGVSSTTNSLPASGGGNVQPPAQKQLDLCDYFCEATKSSGLIDDGKSFQLHKELIEKLTDAQYNEFIKQIELRFDYDCIPPKEWYPLKIVWSDPRASKLSFDPIYQKIKAKDATIAGHIQKLLGCLNAGTFQLFFNCFQKDDQRPEYLLSILCAHPEFLKNNGAIEFVSQTYCGQKVDNLDKLLPTLDEKMFQDGTLNPHLRIFQTLTPKRNAKWFEIFTKKTLANFNAAKPAVQSTFLMNIKGNFYNYIAKEYINNLVLEKKGNLLTSEQISVLKTIVSHIHWDDSLFQELVQFGEQNICTLLKELDEKKRPLILNNIAVGYSKAGNSEKLALWANLLEIVKEYILDEKTVVNPADCLFFNFIKSISHCYSTQINGGKPSSKQQKVFAFIIKHAESIAGGDHFKQVVLNWSTMDKTALRELLSSMSNKMLHAAVNHILNDANTKENFEILEIVKDLYMQEKLQPQRDPFKQFIVSISRAYKRQATSIIWKPTEQQIEVFKFIVKHEVNIPKTQQQFFTGAMGYWLGMDNVTMLQTLKSMNGQMLATTVNQIFIHDTPLIEIKSWELTQERVDILKFALEHKSPEHKENIEKLAKAVTLRLASESARRGDLWKQLDAEAQKAQK